MLIASLIGWTKIVIYLFENTLNQVEEWLLTSSLTLMVYILLTCLFLFLGNKKVVTQFHEQKDEFSNDDILDA